MKLTLYQVDAFAENVFEGNPAAVVPLDDWLPDEVLQNIALENNLSETAFFVPGENGFKIRWFTPLAEVDLCGHATLATSHVLFKHLNYEQDEIHFESRSGILKVTKDNGHMVMNFPSSKVEAKYIPPVLKTAFNVHPVKCFVGREDLLLVFNSEKDIQKLKPDFISIADATNRGLICTAKSEEYDFVSRFFAPSVGIDEDPVTGSAHTMLIPYWAKQLNKTSLVAKQMSKRGGVLYCKYLDDRVEIGGKAVTYMQGEITI
jgi:PhzF family phenazine biosynthesis protein